MDQAAELLDRSCCPPDYRIATAAETLSPPLAGAGRDENLPHQHSAINPGTGRARRVTRCAPPGPDTGWCPQSDAPRRFMGRADVEPNNCHALPAKPNFGFPDFIILNFRCPLMTTYGDPQVSLFTNCRSAAILNGLAII